MGRSDFGETTYSDSQGKTQRMMLVSEADLRRYGTVRVRTAPYKTGNGTVKETEEYWLNHGQAVRVLPALKPGQKQPRIFGTAREVREVIEANREELLEYGVLPSVTAEVARSHGAKRRVKEYWLNKEQALAAPAPAPVLASG
jgi:hypothetical protein